MKRVYSIPVVLLLAGWAAISGELTWAAFGVGPGLLFLPLRAITAFLAGPVNEKFSDTGDRIDTSRRGLP